MPRATDKVGTAKSGAERTSEATKRGRARVVRDSKNTRDLSTAERNRAPAKATPGTVSLEDSKSGKPSRKSTRSSANHVKSATQLTRRTQRAVRAPKARATRAQAKATTVRGGAH